MKKYWVVYNSKTASFQSHLTRIEAEVAAKALAIANLGTEFVIFEAIASVKQPKEEEPATPGKDYIDQLEIKMAKLETELAAVTDERDDAVDRLNKLEDKIDAIRQKLD